MPIIDPPGGGPITLPQQAESADGRVRVITFPAGGGVFVFADFSDLNPTPKKVRFVRGPDHVPVRSGNDAWAPGGSAVAFDREAPSGRPSAWYAIPIMRIAGKYVEGAMSAGAQVVAPSPDTTLDFWLKSLAVPVDLRLEAWGPDPEGSLEGRDAGQPRPNSLYQAGGWDVPIKQPVTYTFRTYTHAQFDQLQEFVTYGPVLVQSLRLYGIEDEFAKIGSVNWSYLKGAYSPEREVTITFNPCLRPPTTDAPLLIPGRTFDLVAQTYESFDDIVARVATFYDLLIDEPPPPDVIIPETGGMGDEGIV